MCLCVCSSRCSILAVSFFRVHYSLVNRPIRPLRAFVYIPAGILRVPVKPRQQDPSLVKSIMGLSYNLNTRVQTADQIITIMHTPPAHQFMSWEEKRWNKPVTTLPPVKKCSVLNQIKQRLQDKTALNTYQLEFDVRDNRRWRKHYYRLWTYFR